MRPDNSLQFAYPPRLSETALQNALNMLEINLTEGDTTIIITVGQYELFRAAEIANEMTRAVTNLTVKVLYNKDYSDEEWSVRDLSTNITVWCQP